MRSLLLPTQDYNFRTVLFAPQRHKLRMVLTEFLQKSALAAFVGISRIA
jgi:hypothetical protein